MKKFMSIMVCASIVTSSIGVLASEVPLNVAGESTVQEHMVLQNEAFKLSEFLVETNTDFYFSTSDDLLLKLSKENTSSFEKIIKIENLSDQNFISPTALEFGEMSSSNWDFRDDILYIDEFNVLNLHDYAEMIRADVKRINNPDYTDDVVTAVSECKIDENKRILKVKLNVLGPGYMPAIYRYVVMDQNGAKEIKIPSESTYIDDIYALDGDIWLSGGVSVVHEFGSSRVWKLDDEFNLVDTESTFKNKFTKINKEKNETVQSRIIGVSNDKIVMSRHIRFYNEENRSDMRLDGIYEISKSGSIEKRLEMLDTDGHWDFILGKNNKIYFFDSFDNKLINLTDNTTLILPTIMK